MEVMDSFTPVLEEWYSRNGRSDLPWRGISDPYRIWISEIILQQTRVVQGMDYYLRFIERFPDVFQLAEADEDEVMRLWQGLGYYSRARNLHAAAKAIAEAGAFPDTYEGVRGLKGIGDYTAAAICSFAYRLPYPVVDGNVYRVLSRIFGIDTPIDTLEGKKRFTRMAEELLDKEHPDIWNSAIMDFGATQCTPKSPDCLFCPFLDDCVARKTDRIQDLPVKAKKTEVKDRHFVYVYIEDGKDVLLRRRPEGDIWQGLYEPFLMEFSSEPTEEEARSRFPAEAGMEIEADRGWQWQRVKKGLKHVLTHRKLLVDCYHVRAEVLPEVEGYRKVALSSRDSLAVPKIITTLYGLIDGMDLRKNTAGKKE